MKKYIVIMLISLVMVFTSAKNVEAYPWGEEYPTDGFTVWYNYDLGDARLHFDASLLGDKEVLNIYLPANEMYALESQNGVYEYELSFYDYSYNLIDTFSWVDLFTTNGETRLSGNFSIDIRSLGINMAEANTVQIQVPLTLTFDPTWSGDLVTYLEENSTLSQVNNDTDYFFTYTKGTGFYRFDLRVDIPNNTKNILINIPDVGMTKKYNSYRSVMYLYNDFGSIIDFIYLDSIDVPMYKFFYVPTFDTYDSDDLSYLRLYVYSLTEDFPFDSFVSKNQSLAISFNNENARLIHYMVSGVEVYQEFVLAPDGVPIYDDVTEPEGLEFSHWTLSDGSTFDPANITIEKYLETDIYVYARFTIVGTEVDVNVPVVNYDTDNPFADVYASLGLDNDVGYMLVFFAIVILVTAICVILKLPLFGVVIVDFLVFLLFNNWGMIPSYLIVLLYILFGVFGLFSIVGISRGGNNYE